MRFFKINPYSQSTPRSRQLQNITFLCRFVHLIQFLMKQLLYIETSIPTLWGVVGFQTNFLCSSGYFIQFLAKKYFCKLTLPSHIHPLRGRSWETWTFSADMDISFNPSKENLILKFTLPSPTPRGEGLTNVAFLYTSTYFMQFPAKLFSKMTLYSYPMRVGQTLSLYADLDISYTFYQK